MRLHDSNNSNNILSLIFSINIVIQELMTPK